MLAGALLRILQILQRDDFDGVDILNSYMIILKRPATCSSGRFVFPSLETGSDQSEVLDLKSSYKFMAAFEVPIRPVTPYLRSNTIILLPAMCSSHPDL